MRAFAAPTGVFVSEKPNLAFGVLSDIHIGYLQEKTGSIPLKTFKRALEQFKADGVDAVAVCGDLANSGLVRELESVARTWFEVFPEGCGVEKLFVTGNHDWEGWLYDGKTFVENFSDEERERIKLCNDYRGHWELCFREPYAPVWMKRVKGYAFVGAHWLGCGADKKGRTCHGKNENFNDGVAAFYAAHEAELKGVKPFFHIQHPHPKDTCFGADAWGYDTGETTKALSAFPNAVAFSGHSHAPLTDERSVWQGAFTSVNGGSLRYASRPKPESERGDENGVTPAGKAVDDGKLQQHVHTGDGNPALLVRVYDDRIVLTRRAVDSGLLLGDNWVIPLSADVRPCDYAKRRAAAVAPAFPAGASLSFSRGKGMTRAKEVKDDVITVSIPAANADPRARAVRYVVKVTDGAGKELACKSVIAAGYNLPEEKSRTPCLFAADELPPAVCCRFSVVPKSCWGLEGVPLSGVFSENARSDEIVENGPPFAIIRHH